jgi:gamma-glutamylcyclotransferase (GGCT)/AIG2-like uncharacterized protein YtfP
MNNPNYFAYGSNLNAADLGKWCTENNKNPKLIKPCGVGYLPDYELVFNYYSKKRGGGALNLKPRPGQLVAGVIFEVSEGGKELLDKKEGTPGCYQRIYEIVLTEDGKEIPVFTYRVCDAVRADFEPPTEEYFEIVRQGLKDFGLSDSMLTVVAQNRLPALALTSLFVYGTLMPREVRYSLLEGYCVSEVLPAKASGRLLDLGCYPGMISAEKPEDWVQGELLKIRRIDQALAHLDRIEGFHGFGKSGSLFRRALIRVATGDNHPQLAWTYYFNQDHLQGKLIPSGNWRLR